MTITPSRLILLFLTLFGAVTLRAQAPQSAARPQPQASARPAVARVTPGELVVDPPTLINLGFEWLIEGDDNRNAVVDVSYRKVGDAQWKKGMPLLRLRGERVTQPNVFN